MPTLPAWDFCGPCYQAITPILDAQDCLNLYPEPALGSSKSHMGLVGTPGLSLLGTVGSGPIRALWPGNGRLFVVSGKKFYEVGAAGQILTDYGFLSGATDPNNPPCQIESNGNDLLVLDGGGSLTCFQNPGVNPGFTSHTIEYLDTFYFVGAPDFPAGQPTNKIRQSASLDGTTWPVLAFAVKTGTQDFVTRLVVVNSNLWLMGQKTTEVWYDVGTSPFSLSRVNGATIQVGLLFRFSANKINNTLFWLGGDDRGATVAYTAAGVAPVRVSNYAIEQLMQGYQSVSEVGISVFPGYVRGFAYQEAGHTFWVLNFNATAANPGGSTLVYDVSTGLWHRRGYLNPGSGLIERIRADCFASVPGFGPNSSVGNLVGDYQNGNIYRMSLSTPADNGNPILRMRVAPHISGSNRWFKHRRFELAADIGTATPVFDYSDDGGRTFPAGTVRNLTKSTASTPGGFGKYYALQLGRSRDRVYRVKITSSTQLIRLIDAYVDANPGIER